MCYGQTSYNYPTVNMPSTLDSMTRAEEGLGREGVCVEQAPHWDEVSEPHTEKPDLHTRSHAMGEARLPHKAQPQLGFPGHGPRSHSCRRVKNKGRGLFLGTLNSTRRIHFREGDSLKGPSRHETQQQRKAVLWRARLTRAGPARSTAAPTPEEAHRAASGSPQPRGTRNPLTNRGGLGQQPTSSLFIFHSNTSWPNFQRV